MNIIYPFDQNYQNQININFIISHDLILKLKIVYLLKCFSYQIFIKQEKLMIQSYKNILH
jgi:hypothetical protein